jgi:hypothetical protein
MRLPSITYVTSEARRTAFRFPVTLVCAFTAAVCAILLIDNGNDESGVVTRLLMVSQMGIPLSIALELLARRRGGDRSFVVRWFYRLSGLILLVAYYVTLPADISTVAFIRFIQLNVGLHLLVAVMPYLGVDDANGFWQYNKTLFLRLLSGLVFSITLFSGLGIAIAALDQLFGVDVGEEIYFRLWCSVIFVFNTWYFLGGIPADLRELSQRRDYPSILKVFSQYILAPLVAIYLVILLAYFFKILVTTQWPSGWIGYLVSSVGTVGLFSLVLLHPLVGQPENRWVNTYARLFYIFLLPAIVMLLLAIYKRIAQYGVTENRYFLTVLTLWLAFVTLYGLFSRKKTIKVIPVTLCIVAFVTSIGPWGAYSVSRSSQLQRLTGLLQANRLLEAGRLVPAKQDVTVQARKEISAVFDYLIDRHGLETVSPWFDAALTAEVDSIPGYGPRNKRHHYEITSAVMTYLDLEYPEAYARSSPPVYYFARAISEEPTDISGYDVARYFEYPTPEPGRFLFDGVAYQVGFADGPPRLVVSVAEEPVVEIPLSPVFDALTDRATRTGQWDRAPGDLLNVEASGASVNVEVLLMEISWSESDQGIEVNAVKAIVLLDLRR